LDRSCVLPPPSLVIEDPAARWLGLA
jgi:hypothetical protein